MDLGDWYQLRFFHIDGKTQTFQGLAYYGQLFQAFLIGTCNKQYIIYENSNSKAKKSEKSHNRFENFGEYPWNKTNNNNNNKLILI